MSDTVPEVASDDYRICVFRLDGVASEWWPVGFFIRKADAETFMKLRELDPNKAHWVMTHMSLEAIKECVAGGLKGIEENMKQWRNV